ncbi:hypothetical protein C7H84_05895 [Burkholderia sp. Nafp2/4-1b]|uniref:hypothetical protein n=1 Tax=Burkholderia sp. Nafp2/4-1b TaxID=2116686 RepID=UPI000EF890C1|nr:hypothetical protein [Burkholderia sp. Nafp2/4-1b]RKU04441.1 hypothetical protein C7H84_05895 [Burkholderia sp. Nafp2/4-1b]
MQLPFNARLVEAKHQTAHKIVQHALKSAAIADTLNGAIDVLGDALLELELMIEHEGPGTH